MIFSSEKPKSRISTTIEFIKTFLQSLKEDWDETDHKLLRIVVGGGTMIAMVYFWYYFLRMTSPF